MRLRPCGEAAVLVEPGEGVDVLGLRQAVLGAVGVIEVVPAACTLLVQFDPAATTVEAIEHALTDVAVGTHPQPTGDAVELEVHYDGADLAAVAYEIGVGVGEVIARHSAGTYTVAFCGFAPGFAYLSGLDPALQVARLAEPRKSVPAGSVGIAGEFTGVYPRASPGGWRLLGHTSASLWDSRRQPPALLGPGTTVRFLPS
jgi:KipI family sensor histidine kinase inhibitor